MKTPVSTTLRRLEPSASRTRLHFPRGTCECRWSRRNQTRRFGNAACGLTAVARLKWQISRLCDMVQRFSTVLPPELCFPSASAVAVVSHVTICLASRLSVASSSRQATRSTVQLLFLTPEAIAETPACAELRRVEGPLGPVDHLDASSWRRRRAVLCESEASMVLRMLDLNTRTLEEDEDLGCGTSLQSSQVRQPKSWHRGYCGASAHGNRLRSHRQQQKYRVVRRFLPQQQCVELEESRQVVPGPLQTEAVACNTSVGSRWDLAPSSSELTYTSSLRQEPLTADQKCDWKTSGDACQNRDGPCSNRDSAFFTCSSNLSVPPHHATQLAAHGGCVSAAVDFASSDISPSRRTLRRRCTAMTEKLRLALNSAEVIPSRIRELLSEAVDLVGPGVSGIPQDCRVSVDTLNCIDLDLDDDVYVPRDPLRAPQVAITDSMGDCNRDPTEQTVLRRHHQQEHQKSQEWDLQTEMSQLNAGAVSRRHHDRRQRHIFELMRRRRNINTSG